MKIWTPADIGSIVSFPRKHETRRDYFRVMGIDQEAQTVDLEALSKQDAAAEQDKQDRMDRLGELCWHHYGVKEGLVRYGVQIKRRDDPMVAYDRLLAAAYEMRPIVDEA